MKRFGLLVFIALAAGGCMKQAGAQSSGNETQAFIAGFWGVRYQVKDVARSVAFYTNQLGFKLDLQNLPAFGQVSIGNLKLVLSGTGASGSRPMPDGRSQEPRGWNRIVLQVTNLPEKIEALKKDGLHFRNTMEAGPGGKQIQLEDPDGNPIELFEPRAVSRSAIQHRSQALLETGDAEGGGAPGVGNGDSGVVEEPNRNSP